MSIKKDGVVIVNKSTDISSQGVVNRIKKIFGVSKAGHTGTLDPMATGVLPVLIGRGVKASEFMLTDSKRYRATLLLGIATDTEDITGQTLSRYEGEMPDEDSVMSAIASFRGKIMQTPPMYSALKVGGKKLYELARQGQTVEREQREIEIYSLNGSKISDTEYTLDVHCSKGTYIRTLCNDIGQALGVGGVMKTLMRTEASGYGIDRALTLEEMESMSSEELEALIIPTEDIFKDKKAVILPDFFSALAHSGLEIYLHKIGISLELDEIVRLKDKDGFFAIGQVRDFDGKYAIKPIRQFVI